MAGNNRNASNPKVDPNVKLCLYLSLQFKYLHNKLSPNGSHLEMFKSKDTLTLSCHFPYWLIYLGRNTQLF